MMAEYTHLILSCSKTSILAQITSAHIISLYLNSCHKSEPSRSKDKQMSAAINVLHSSNEFPSAIPTGRANLLVCFVALILLVSRFIIIFFNLASIPPVQSSDRNQNVWLLFFTLILTKSRSVWKQLTNKLSTP